MLFVQIVCVPYKHVRIVNLFNFKLVNQHCVAGCNKEKSVTSSNVKNVLKFHYFHRNNETLHSE